MEVSVVPDYTFAEIQKDKTVDQYQHDFKVIKLTRSGFTVNSFDMNDPYTPLLVAAAKRGLLNAVKALLADAEININATDGKLRTALHHACKIGRPDIIKALLNFKPDKSAERVAILGKDTEGKTPLSYLSDQSEQKKIVQIVLYRTCEIGRSDVVIELLKIGADPNQLKSTIESNLDGDDPDDRSALHIAVQCGKEEVVSTLLECPTIQIDLPSGIDRANSALHIACFCLWPNIVKKLIEKGANVKALNTDNQTAFMFAFVGKKPNIKNDEFAEIVEIFSNLPKEKFDIKEEIRTRRSSSGNTYLHLAISKLNMGYVKTSPRSSAPGKTIIDFLLDNIPKGDPILNAENKEGLTSLHCAVEKYSDIIPALLDKGALIQVNINDLTPIDFAVTKANGPILAKLLEGLTRIQFISILARRRKNESMLLHEAAKIDVGDNTFNGDKSNILLLLLEKIKEKKDILKLINLPDADGNTPAHIALLHGKYRNYIYLEQFGANSDAKNRAKQTVRGLIFRDGRNVIINNMKIEMSARAARAQHEAKSKPELTNLRGSNSGSLSRRSSSAGVTTLAPPAGEGANTNAVVANHEVNQGSSPIGQPSAVSDGSSPAVPAPRSEPASARSEGGSSDQTKAEAETLLYNSSGNKPAGLFTRVINRISNSALGKHISRNRRRYIIGAAIVGILLATTGFLAVCTFYPPMILKVPLLYFVAQGLTKVGLVSMPVAQAITVCVPAIFVSVGLACVEGVKFVQSIWSKLKSSSSNKQDNNLVVDGSSSNTHQNTSASPVSPQPSSPVNTPGKDNGESWFDAKRGIGPYVASFKNLLCCVFPDTDNQEDPVQAASAESQANLVPTPPQSEAKHSPR